MFLSLADVSQLHHQNQSSLNTVCCLALPLPVSSGEANQELAIIQYLKALDEQVHSQNTVSKCMFLFLKYYCGLKQDCQTC